MLTKVIVENFRGFHSFTANFQETNVLVGPNNAGKTTLMSAIRFACAAYSWVLQEGRVREFREFQSQCKDDYIRIDPLVFLGLKTLLWISVEELSELYFDPDDSFRIELHFSEESLIGHFILNVDDSGNVDVKVCSPKVLAEVQGLEYGTHKRARRILELLRENEPVAVFIPIFPGAGPNEEYRSTHAVERMMMRGQQSQIIRNLVVRLDRAGLARLNRLLRESVGATISSFTSKSDFDRVENLKVYFRDQEGELELASAGAGFSSLIAIFSALWRYRKSIVERRPVFLLLDEPEAHLHPRLQGVVAMYLAELSRELGAQLFIATHSVEAINRLARRSDTSLLVVDKKATSANILASEGVLLDELGRWCDLSLFSSIQFLRSRKILFYEGPSDAELLRQCAEVYFRGQPKLLARFGAWTFVPLGGAGNSAATSVLMQALRPLLSVEGRSGNPVHIVRVLDRDYSRSPALGPFREESGFRLLDVVWSRHSIESLFLDASCLLGWISPVIFGHRKGEQWVSSRELTDIVVASLGCADRDEQLLMEATGQLMIALARTKRDDSTLVNALEQAKSEVGARPDVWQRGRSRAKVVLSEIRSRLPLMLQNCIRRDVVQMVAHGWGDVAQSDVERLVPLEIRKLLDYLTTCDDC
ncbi:hypothetical protein MXAN_5535 [Myxococcus xanthus DK 1622]|uniref:Endonuclease GajA/Old nuclease/RecF-like AAA domain-containing protein n=1 Tax=Myxococcus xanthus (strain DK1622) TaxID=246197 RepID=Q1D0Z7_MYXXD|nr:MULTISPECIES: AAA family ATPase [Myxococcus]ABF87139.1 hypothetical protein MXAN_5535 [Myxococcus xanthus DK 1622]NOJ55367.1 ATP-binding protein [Myxococcus xanthus]QPM77969.1 AAA family ATPase [Myxococcus xanthus]QVW67037.1 AAA family ATPase [Myxococcus xanthus DZ2]QZZ53178.1 DNA replication and repair protein RecF [Myxococcus xanthus]